LSRHGYNDEAVRHAIYSGDVDRAADLVASCARDLIYSGMFRRLIEWAGSLPIETTATRLDLQLSLAWAHVFISRTEVTLDTCRRIESLLAEGDQRSRYELQLLRGAVAVLEDDSEAAWAATQDAAELPESGGSLLTGLRANILAWSLAFKGDHDGARNSYLSARFDASEEVAPSRRVIGECFYGMSLVLQGDMLAAERVLRDAFTMGARLAGMHAEPACIAAGFLAEVLYEGGQFDEVIKLVGERIDLIEHLAPLDIPLRGLTSLARAHRVRGNRDEAASILARLEEIALLHGHDRALACSLGEQLTGYLADGDLEAAGDAMRRLAKVAQRHPLEPLSATSEIPLLAGMKSIEMDLAEGRARDALERANGLLMKCVAWRRNQAAVRLNLLASRAQLALHDRDAACRLVETAVQTGLRRGLVRTFLDEGPQVTGLMHILLSTASLDGGLRDHVARLLASDAEANPPPVGALPGSAASNPPTERLTERELEIVGMLSRVLTNKKIARALGISDGTVKWHMKNIYGKLGVMSRDEALARCRDLGLLG
jgi:LuxR family maltose regulon positive regulatory protein